MHIYIYMLMCVYICIHLILVSFHLQKPLTDLVLARFVAALGSHGLYIEGISGLLVKAAVLRGLSCLV